MCIIFSCSEYADCLGVNHLGLSFQPERLGLGQPVACLYPGSFLLPDFVSVPLTPRTRPSDLCFVAGYPGNRKSFGVGRFSSPSMISSYPMETSTLEVNTRRDTPSSKHPDITFSVPAMRTPEILTIGSTGPDGILSLGNQIQNCLNLWTGLSWLIPWKNTPFIWFSKNRAKTINKGANLVMHPGGACLVSCDA